MNTTDTNERLETAEKLLKKSYDLLYDILLQLKFYDRVDHDGWHLVYDISDWFKDAGITQKLHEELK